MPQFANRKSDVVAGLTGLFRRPEFARPLQQEIIPAAIAGLTGQFRRPLPGVPSALPVTPAGFTLDGMPGMGEAASGLPVPDVAGAGFDVPILPTSALMPETEEDIQRREVGFDPRTISRQLEEVGREGRAPFIDEALDKRLGIKRKAEVSAEDRALGEAFLGLGLGQVQAAKGAPSHFERWGGMITAMGGLLKMTGGSKLGMGIAMLGTLLNMHGQRQSQKRRGELQRGWADSLAGALTLANRRYRA
jgi:hypothetical protein